MIISPWEMPWELPNRLGRGSVKEKSNRTKSYFSRNCSPRAIFWDFFILHAHRRYLRTAALKSWVLEISFLAIPMLTGRKTVQKEGFGPKCGFFLKSGWRQRIRRDLTIRKWRRPWKKVTQLLQNIEVRLELKEGTCPSSERISTFYRFAIPVFKSFGHFPT